MSTEHEQKVVRLYVNEIEDAVAAHEDAGAVVAKMRDMRGRVRRDFLAGNLSERRYRNLMNRIGIELSDARTHEVEPLLTRLPAGMRVRFEVLLEDGILTDEEYGLFEDMLRTEKVAADVSGPLLTQLKQWVAEDGGRL